MHRRHCLHTLAALAAAGPAALVPTAASMAATRSPAAGQAPRLLLVFLRGGYDCAHLLVPHASSFYYESRPHIAIARPGEPDGALALDADWGLHPALAATLAPLYRQKQVAFVPFSGTEDLSRSHFDTQDSIELGQPLSARRDYRSGFLNRLAAEIGAQARWRDGLSPMAFTDTLPLVLRGSYDVPNTALSATAGKSSIDERQAEIIASMYGGTPLAAPVAEGFQTRSEVARSMQGEKDAASRSALSTKGFEGTARRMARLMQSRYDLGFVDVGGWDTHVGQGGASGALANRFEELGRGLAAFADEMGAPAWRQTTVVVLSEFGRTFRENGNRGTDHGHGSVMWVLGGGVAGGRIAGEQQAVTAATLFQNRDYPVLNDYRSVLGGLFARMYGLPPPAIARVFPSTKASDLKLV
ncbi:MAG: DUF1501 domain-containing protein [Comamonadaceae bacterium]|nr:MAG: DUF1501 domain-containing protein [Comamonadaceae bacterium]